MNPPPVRPHLGRPTTRAAARRTQDRVVADVNNLASTLVNKASGTPIGGHGANLIGDGTQLISSTPTTCTFTSAQFDTDSWWSVSDASRVIVSFTGIYVVSGLMTPLTDGVLTSVGEWTLEILNNGSTVHLQVGYFVVRSSVPIATPLTVNTILSLAAGDKLQLRMSQNSGTSYFVDQTNSEFAVALIGTL